MTYIKILVASRIANISESAVYQAMKRGALQYKIIRGLRYTTKDWLNAYLISKNNRQRVHFQGKPLYDFHKGEWSVKMTATYMNTSINIVHMYIRKGELKTQRRGSYHVVDRDSVMEKMKVLEKESISARKDMYTFEEKEAYWKKMLYENTA